MNKVIILLQDLFTTLTCVHFFVVQLECHRPKCPKNKCHDNYQCVHSQAMCTQNSLLGRTLTFVNIWFWCHQERTVPGTSTPYTLASWMKSTSPMISVTSVVATFSPFHLKTNISLPNSHRQATYWANMPSLSCEHEGRLRVNKVRTSLTASSQTITRPSMSTNQKLSL